MNFADTSGPPRNVGDGPMHFILGLPTRVIASWLQEFGYTQGPPPIVDRDTLLRVATERGLSRWATELDIHAKRLADRAQMGPQRIGGAARVIR